jgi:rhodanese-related sulfurtransferase
LIFQRKPSITPEQAAERLAAGELVLVDVREPAEVREAHVEGATNIPLGELRHRVAELERRPVAFLCRSGARSSMATGAALKAGHDAVNVKGGMIAWSRAGLPLTRKES